MLSAHALAESLKPEHSLTQVLALFVAGACGFGFGGGVPSAQSYAISAQDLALFVPSTPG